MLSDIDIKTYRHFFPVSPHPFISESFVELNKRKTERIVRLAEDSEKKDVGLVAGVKDYVIISPFSAPFGGFHFRNEIIHCSEIDKFIQSIKEYILEHSLRGIEIILPPDLYHPTFNAKTINSFIRNGFSASTPDITGWVILDNFREVFTQKNSREYYRQAVRNNLSFGVITDITEKNAAYNLISENRSRFGRPIYMSFEDVLKTAELWPVDFFKVINRQNELVAAAIFYRSHPVICYAVFWGDSDQGRHLRAFDFLAFNLWSFYKALGFKYIDLGVSTEAGIPNEGLLRFKESHESVSSLKYKFSWYSH